MLEAQLVGASGKLTPSQGPPSHPSADAPRSRCEESSGLGARSQLLVGRVSGVLTLLQAGIPPPHTRGGKAETSFPRSHPHFSGPEGSRDETASVGGEGEPAGLCALPWLCPGS